MPDSGAGTSPGRQTLALAQAARANASRLTGWLALNGVRRVWLTSASSPSSTRFPLINVRSRNLMRSLFSQSRTPTAPRRAVGFFRFGCPSGCPAWLITQSTSGQQFLFAVPFDLAGHRTMHRPVQPRLTWLRVSPPPVSPGCAGDGCYEFPRAPHPLALQVAKSPGFPESLTVLPRLSTQSSGLPESCIFRLYRRWFIEFPRALHPSAPPPSKLQVSPSLRLPASPCDESPGFPASSSSGRRRCVVEFPRVPHPSAALAA